MKIKLISDLHLNHYKPNISQSIFSAVNDGDYDLIIFAGDTDNRKFTENLNKRKNTIAIHGNHEFYTKGYDNGMETNFIRYINGYKFVCSTMFSKLDPMYWMEIVRGITDFLYVDVNKFDELFKKAKTFLEKEVTEGCIVVTHFVPTYMALAEQYKKSYINSFFITEMFELIADKKPLLWHFGHTHTNWDFMIDKTRMVCNPLGYFAENPRFNPDLIVEI